MSIEFDFLTSQQASQMALVVPKVRLVVHLDSDLFVFDRGDATTKKLPENFYLRTAAHLPPKLAPEDILEFLEKWGPPFPTSTADYETGVGLRRVSKGIGLLREIARFAVDWFESDRAISPAPKLAKAIDSALASLAPRFRVSGLVENGGTASVTALAIAQWADDIDAGRVLRECEFCGERFTKQQGRSVSGRYRTTEQTRFCSHSCANRKGNQRRRIQKKEIHG